MFWPMHRTCHNSAKLQPGSLRTHQLLHMVEIDSILFALCALQQCSLSHTKPLAAYVQPTVTFFTNYPPPQFRVLRAPRLLRAPRCVPRPHARVHLGRQRQRGVGRRG